MAKSWRGWCSLTLEIDELAMDHFSINDYRLEVPQLILKFTSLVSSTKVIDSFQNRIALFTQNKPINKKVNDVKLSFRLPC